MPIHDWTRVPWAVSPFPPGLDHRDRPCAEPGAATRSRRLVDSAPGRVRPMSWPSSGARSKPPAIDGGVVVRERPVTRIVRRTTKDHADRANRIVVKHHLGRIIAVIEILSPGNKDSRAALRDFVEKIIDLLRKGVHVLIVDLFPPTPRDPFGIHKVSLGQDRRGGLRVPGRQGPHPRLLRDRRRAGGLRRTGRRSATGCRTCRCS